MSSPETRAFFTHALAYARSGADEAARALFCSPLSGIPGTVSAAILKTAAPRDALFDAVAAGRVPLEGELRDRVFGFTSALRAFREAASAGASEGAVRADAAARFGVDPPAEAAEAVSPPELAPAPAPPAETPSPVPPRTMHFSASALNTYVECKRKWYYRYLCAAVEDKGSSASFYGTAFHAALEDLHSEFPQPGIASAQTLRTKLQGYLNGAFDRFASRFDTKIELELQRRRAIRTADRYVDWLVAETARAPFTVIGCELEANLLLEGYEFVGYIDRLDRDESTGNVTVIDYKTGNIAQSADEYRQKVRQFKEFQLPFYYWARTSAGDRVTQLALVPLKDALLEVAPIALEVVPAAAEPARRATAARGLIPIAELERARTRMIEICRELSDGAIAHFETATDPEACRYCAYVTACRNRPAAAEERFGR